MHGAYHDEYKGNIISLLHALHISHSGSPSAASATGDWVTYRRAKAEVRLVRDVT